MCVFVMGLGTASITLWALLIQLLYMYINWFAPATCYFILANSVCRVREATPRFLPLLLLLHHHLLCRPDHPDQVGLSQSWTVQFKSFPAIKI